MKSNDEIYNSIKKQISNIGYVNPDAIPNIDLYMDQVTTFMDKQLFAPDRVEGEHIITKTMINNYAKSELIPPPVKKKYSKDHILMLIFTHYFKNFLSIGDINSLFKPIKDNYINKQSDINLEHIYREIFEAYKKQLPELISHLDIKEKAAMESFKDISEDDAETLQLFSLICSMSFDIYLQKFMVEALIEQMNERLAPLPATKPSKKDKKDSN